MPKIKTHSGAKKRFKLTKNGKVKRGHAYRSHLLNGHGKTTKIKRGYRKNAPPPAWRAVAYTHLTRPTTPYV